MVSIILIVVGGIIILSGIGLRPLLRAFGTMFSLLGVLFVLDGVLGMYFHWSDYKKVIIAGGTLILFTIITLVWQLLVKFRETQK